MDKTIKPIVRSIPEKLDPNPQTITSTQTVEIIGQEEESEPVESETQVEAVQKNIKRRIKAKREKTEDDEKRKITTLLPAGFSMNHRSDAVWAMIAEVLAKEGELEQAVDLLKSFKIADKKQAKTLIDLILVEKTKLESLLLEHPTWKKRGLNKLQNLKNRAEKGNKKAIAKLNDPKIVKNDVWCGDISKTISNCICVDKDKYSNIGLAITQFPQRAKFGEPVFFAIHPIMESEKIIQAYNATRD